LDAALAAERTVVAMLWQQLHKAGVRSSPQRSAWQMDDPAEPCKSWAGLVRCDGEGRVIGM
jgi:hypothetical protein